MIPMEQPPGYISPALIHRWSLFSRGAIPSTQRLGHRNFHLHTWRKNSQQLASSVRIFWLAHLSSAPRNRPRKKHDILVCIAVFAFGVQKMASLAVLIMKHKPEIHSKKWEDMTGTTKYCFHLPHGNNLSFGHGWMSRLNNLAIFQLEFLWDGSDLWVFLGERGWQLFLLQTSSNHGGNPTSWRAYIGTVSMRRVPSTSPY